MAVDSITYFLRTGSRYLPLRSFSNQLGRATR